MIPGLRFLLMAIVLSLSVLVFGIGATALLRAAHEEFASDPSWRAAPETTIAQQSELKNPILAVLQVDTLPPEPKPADQIQTIVPPLQAASSAPAEPVLTGSAQTDPGTLTTAMPDDVSGSKSQPPNISVAEIPPRDETDTRLSSAAPAPVEPISVAPEQSLQPAGALSPAESEAAPAASEHSSTPAATPENAPIKTVNLQTPTATIETEPQVNVANRNTASATAERVLAKKRLQARREAYQRRMALRARIAQQEQLLAQQAQQQVVVQPSFEPLTPASN